MAHTFAPFAFEVLVSFASLKSRCVTPGRLCAVGAITKRDRGVGALVSSSLRCVPAQDGSLLLNTSLELRPEDLGCDDARSFTSAAGGAGGTLAMGRTHPRCSVSGDVARVRRDPPVLRPGRCLSPLNSNPSSVEP